MNYPASLDDVEPQTFPAYSYPSQIAPTSPFQSAVNPGLGISYRETGPSHNYVRPCPSTELYPADWTGQLMPTIVPFLYSLNTSQMTPATLCEPYAGSDISASPLSYCGPQAMSATSSRGSALDLGTGSDTMNPQMYSFLPNTPRSDADVMIKEEPDADYLDGQYAEYAKPAPVPLFAPVAQHGANAFRPKFEYSEEDDTGEPIVVEHDLESNLSGTSMYPVEGVSLWTSIDPPADHEQTRIPSASGRECTICGARFTRRSNCREHMKRHNPSNRKSYACEICGKALGRKTDLKRHVDSVHRGIRKYGCEECGSRFTRQDTLARWMQTSRSEAQ
ncbi:hypothetical protein BDV10DRAFT_193848 [Aspergillus recurvatus]